MQNANLNNLRMHSGNQSAALIQIMKQEKLNLEIVNARLIK